MLFRWEFMSCLDDHFPTKWRAKEQQGGGWAPTRAKKNGWLNHCIISSLWVCSKTVKTWHSLKITVIPLRKQRTLLRVVWFYVWCIRSCQYFDIWDLLGLPSNWDIFCDCMIQASYKPFVYQKFLRHPMKCFRKLGWNLALSGAISWPYPFFKGEDQTDPRSQVV